METRVTLMLISAKPAATEYRRPQVANLSLKQGSSLQTSTFVAAVLRLPHTIYSTTTELNSCQMCHVELLCMPLVSQRWR